MLLGLVEFKIYKNPNSTLKAHFTLCLDLQQDGFVELKLRTPTLFITVFA